MKVLSIYGPWAQLIALGLKDVENRSWLTKYRGPLAIHCSKGGWTRAEAMDILAECVEYDLIDMGQAASIMDRMDGDRGMIVAIANVTGSRAAAGHKSPWANPDGNVIELANVRMVEPVAVRGQQGLRDLDPVIVAALTRIEP